MTIWHWNDKNRKRRAVLQKISQNHWWNMFTHSNRRKPLHQSDKSTIKPDPYKRRNYSGYHSLHWWVKKKAPAQLFQLEGQKCGLGRPRIHSANAWESVCGHINIISERYGGPSGPQCAGVKGCQGSVTIGHGSPRSGIWLDDADHMSNLLEWPMQLLELFMFRG